VSWYGHKTSSRSCCCCSVKSSYFAAIRFRDLACKFIFVTCIFRDFTVYRRHELKVFCDFDFFMTTHTLHITCCTFSRSGIPSHKHPSPVIHYLCLTYLWPNRRVDLVSVSLNDAGEQQMTIVVRALPPRLSCSMRVNLLSRYGTYVYNDQHVHWTFNTSSAKNHLCIYNVLSI